MIVRPDALPAVANDEETPTRRAVGDAGGLTQLGVYLQTLQPGERTSERHWHEHADELVYVLSGELTVVEDDGEHALGPGNAAAWPAGSSNAHQVVNRSSAPATCLVIGTRMVRDVVHYPDSNRELHDADGRWRLLRGGEELARGVIDQPRTLWWADSGHQ